MMPFTGWIVVAKATNTPYSLIPQVFHSRESARVWVRENVHINTPVRIVRVRVEVVR